MKSLTEEWLREDVADLKRLVVSYEQTMANLRRELAEANRAVKELRAMNERAREDA